MVGLKNTATTLVVTGSLLLGIFVLFPETAEAAKVTNLTSGALDDTGAFTLLTTVTIPAGEHVPLNYAKVLVAPQSSVLAGGVLSTPFCIATTGGSPSATITTVVGASATHNEFSGYGYTITGVDGGYGYSYGQGLSFSGGGNVFSGYGYGYGYGSPSATVTVEVVIKVSGCNFFTGGPSGNSADAFETFRIQAFVGGDAAHTLPSFPLTAVFANKGYVSTSDGSVKPDGSGATVVGGDLPVGIKTNPVDLPHGFGMKSISVTPVSKTIESGSRLNILKSQEVDKKAPSFGILDLSGMFPVSQPLIQFQFVLEKPDGSTTTDLNGVLRTTPVLEVPASYFQDLVKSNIFVNEAEAVKYFRVFAFQSDGALKSFFKQPVVNRVGTDNDPYLFEVGITHYSSFVAGSTKVGVPGGGGGGGGCGTACPVDPPVVTDPSGNTTEPPGVPESPPVVPEPTTGDEEDPTDTTGGKKKTPGLGVGALIGVAVGSSMLLRRRRN